MYSLIKNNCWYIARVDGTDKTHVIKAIFQLFDKLNHKQEIIVEAPTGAAALNIDGHTIHFLTMLLTRNWTIKLDKLQWIWSLIKYLIIDEVSMISSSLLVQISERLQQAKSHDGPISELPFGEFNVIFIRDFD